MTNLALSIAGRGDVLQNGSIALSGCAIDLLDDLAVQQTYLDQRVAQSTGPTPLRGEAGNLYS